MNENDYILLFDQNGSPYIAHASLSEMRQRATGALKSVRGAAMNAAGTAKQGVGRGVRTTHKYIQKIEENGRARYFYTQEELKAYYNEKKAAAQQTLNNVKKKASETTSEAQEKGAHARIRAEQMSKEFQKKPASRKMTEPQLYFSSNHVPPSPTPPKKVYTKDLKGKMEKAKDTIKDKLGYDEQERMNSAKEEYEQAKQYSESAHRSLLNAMDESPVPWERTEEEKKRIDNLTKLRSDMWAEQDKKFKEYLNAQSDYDSTFLGKTDSVRKALKSAKNDADVAMYHAEDKIKKAAGDVKKAAEDAAFEVEYAAKQAVNKVTGNKDAAERDFYLAAANEARKEAEGHGENAQAYYDYVIGELEKKAEKADQRYQQSTVAKAKNAANAVAEKTKDTVNKVSDAVSNKLKEHNGSPSNSEGKTRSMLGSYAINIPSEPDKLKEWADGGKQQAQQVLNEAEQEFKKLEQDFKNGKITQQQMWMAQGIMEGLRDEMSEWEYLSDMNADQLSDLFGPLLKKK